jgi:hypothetical protein
MFVYYRYSTGSPDIPVDDSLQQNVILTMFHDMFVYYSSRRRRISPDYDMFDLDDTIPVDGYP